jgi:hypothetical protein
VAIIVRLVLLDGFAFRPLPITGKQERQQEYVNCEVGILDPAPECFSIFGPHCMWYVPCLMEVRDLFEEYRGPMTMAVPAV